MLLSIFMLACGISSYMYTVFSKYLFHTKKSHNFIKMKHACKTDQMLWAINKLLCQNQEDPREWLSGLSPGKGKCFSKGKNPVQNKKK